MAGRKEADATSGTIDGSSRPAAIYSVFISAASVEFGLLRQDLKDAIDGAYWKVWTQKNLQELGEPTLQKLDRYIKDCHCVIQLAGRQSGGRPRTSSLQWIKDTYPDFVERLPAVRKFLESASDTLSLTQWEAWLAEYHRVRLLIWGPQSVVDDLMRARVAGRLPSEGDRQHEHLALLWERDRHCEGYSKQASLVGKVHVALDQVRAKLDELAMPISKAFVWPPSLPVAADTIGGNFVGREWLFDLVDAWAADDGALPLLLLGGFGMGKTTALLELGRRWADRKTVWHFCQFNNERSLRPGRVVQNIAGQLSQLFPEYEKAVMRNKYLQSLLDDAEKSPARALREAVFAPLDRLVAPARGPCFVIVDGLDESMEITKTPSPGQERPVTLFDLVVDPSITVPKWLRILIASRPIDGLRSEMVRRHFVAVEFESDGKSYSDQDVEAYVGIRAKAEIRIRDFLDEAGRTTGELAKKLSAASAGRFLLLKYVLDDIRDGHIAASRFDEVPVRVGAFYEFAFKYRVAKANLSLPKVMELLGLVAVARMPIPSRSLAGVMTSTTHAEVIGIFNAFSGLLVRDERGGINFAHFSLEEWLDGKTEPGCLTPEDFLIDRAQAEQRLLEYCRQMTTRPLAEAGEFQEYLESYGLRLMADKKEFATAIELLNAMRARLAELRRRPERAVERTVLDGRCAKQTVLFADRVRAQWEEVDEGLGMSRQRAREPLARIEPAQLQQLLHHKDYETGKYVPIVRTLIDCHSSDWQEIKARMLEMEDQNDIVFRHDAGVAYAQAWHAASRQDKPALMGELETMARDEQNADLREMAGYALKYICERTDQTSWWRPVLPTIKSLAVEYARRDRATDRMVAGEMLLALALQGENVTRWFVDEPGRASFWNPHWPNHRADINAIRTVLGESAPTDALVDDGPESLDNCRAMSEEAARLGTRLSDSNFFRNTAVGQQFADLLVSDVAQEIRAEAFDHLTVRAFARALQGPDGDDIVDFVRYLMLHPLWNATERASTLVSAMVERDPQCAFLIDRLSEAPAWAWRIRYGAVDAAYNCGGQDNYRRFFDLLIRYRDDRSCRLRGICIDDLNGWIRDADSSEVEARLREPELVGLIRRWLQSADDVWLLEYLHEMFHGLRVFKRWSSRRIAELMAPGVDRLSAYIGDAHFYEQSADDFMAHVECVARSRREQSNSSPTGPDSGAPSSV